MKVDSLIGAKTGAQTCKLISHSTRVDEALPCIVTTFQSTGLYYLLQHCPGFQLTCMKETRRLPHTYE